MTKRKGDFRSKIDSILAEGDGGPAPAALATATDETRTDSIEIGRIFLPKGRRADQDVSELLSSVKRQGVLQPLLLRPVGSRYEVIDGARRLVAAQQTGRTSVPAVVRKLSAAEAKATASKDRPIVARSRTAARTVTASKARAVRKATGKAPAAPPVRAVATAVAAGTGAPRAAVTPMPTAAAKASVKPAAAKAAAVTPATRKAGTGRRPTRRAAAPKAARRSAGVQILDDIAPASLPRIAVEPLPAEPRPVETEASPVKAAALPVETEARPTPVLAPPVGQEPEPVAAASIRQSTESRYSVQHSAEPDVAARASAPPADDVLPRPGRRPSRTRAMAGWYIFLAVLFAASFALTNLAINHEASLSLATGGVAGVGLIAVVVLLATGR